MTDPWHQDPALVGRFHPQAPNDLQVVVHDGEPRRTQRGPEACWVRVDRVYGTLPSPLAPPDGTPPILPAQVNWQQRTIYGGTLLNQPTHLQTLKLDDPLGFVFTPGLPHPLYVSPAYAQERGEWAITPCNKCGADQALDPPSVMAKTRFPQAPAGSMPVAFTAQCGCGGMMSLSMIQR